MFAFFMRVPVGFFFGLSVFIKKCDVSGSQQNGEATHPNVRLSKKVSRNKKRGCGRRVWIMERCPTGLLLASTASLISIMPGSTLTRGCRTSNEILQSAHI